MSTRVRKKAKGAYHHGDLERSLVDAAVRTIQEEGMAALTLRGVGERLGVSRTALYRHFADKAALLARVAAEGFGKLREALEQAVARGRKAAVDPMEEMAGAYVGFAMANPSHYRTMFGRPLAEWGNDPGLITEANAAFAVLVNTIAAEQQAGHIQPGDPVHYAHVIWPVVHGIASLGLDGQLSPKGVKQGELEELAKFAWRSFRDGIGRQ